MEHSFLYTRLIFCIVYMKLFVLFGRRLHAYWNRLLLVDAVLDEHERGSFP